MSLGTGKVVPELTGGAGWPYLAIGVGFGLLGALFIGYGFLRQRGLEEAVLQGAFAPVGERVAAALAALGLVLILATLAVMVIET